MADVTLHPQTLSQPKNNPNLQTHEGKEEHEEKIVLSPLIVIILENPLYSIDPLLLIRICSFLDMLSVMRFECVSLRLSKFLKKNIKLQSLHETNTDYLIDNALHNLTHHQYPNKAEQKANEEQTIPIYSELRYRFPNHHQYDHYILLETDKNIFAGYQHIKQLYLRIIPPNATDLISNPSSSYLSKFHKHKQENQTDSKQAEEDHDQDDNMDYLLLNSAKKRDFSSRPPITKVETSIYSRSIFAYFDHYFQKINHLIIEFDPYLFTATFLTFNIPKILSKITRLSLIKSLQSHSNTLPMTSRDIYCHECVSLLQYTRNLKELIFNFPLSSDFYPVINNLESLKVMHRIGIEAADENIYSPYAQNIVTINENNTTIISNVKLQESLIKYFSPSLRSLHLHGSKGLLNAFGLLTPMDDETLTQSICEKNKVFFGLHELCIHCSESIYDFLYKYMSIVPQLKRLQLVFGKNSNVSSFIAILKHFHANCVLNMSYNADRDNLLQYYYNYYIYYGLVSPISNQAKQLRFLYVITKKTTHSQNYNLLSQLAAFLRDTKISLLHFRLLIQYSYWNTNDLMAVIQLFAGNPFIFGRDSISYQIIMPLQRRYKQSSQSQIKNQIKNIADEYKYKEHEKYKSIPAGNDMAVLPPVIDGNSLKGIASFVKQKNVGKLQVITSPKVNGMKKDDSDIVIVEKLPVAVEAKEKYECYKDFVYRQNEEYKNENNHRKIYKDKITHNLLSQNGDDVEVENNDFFVTKHVNHSKWINECYYCDLLK